MVRIPGRLRGLTAPLALLAALSLVVLLSVWRSGEQAERAEQTPASSRGLRPGQWAMPVERPGLPNLHMVSEGLYRGAQPTAEGFRELKAMGVRTVLDLRSGHSDLEMVRGSGASSGTEKGPDPFANGLGYASIPMHAWDPEEEDIVAFLQVVTDPARAPVFVHCEHGADRTGTVCAAYRVAMQGWSVDQAVDEMVNGGFGFHAIWRERLSGYLRKLDFEEIKRKAGIGGKPMQAPPGP